MFNVRGYFGILMESEPFAFVGGSDEVIAVAAPSGYLIDANLEMAMALITMPDYVDHLHIESLRFQYIEEGEG